MKHTTSKTFRALVTAALFATAIACDRSPQVQASGAQETLLQRVRDELREQPALRDVHASADGDVIVLGGQVASIEDRERTVELIENLPGVHRVENELSVSGAIGTSLTTPRVDTDPR